MHFEYQAIDANGDIVRGIIKAKEPVKVMQILFKKQLHPIDIRPLTESSVELSRLNNLKYKLQGKPIMEETKVSQPEYKNDKATKTDWYYVVFLLLIAGLIATMTLL